MIYLSRFHLSNSKDAQGAHRTFHGFAQYFAALCREPVLEECRLSISGSSAPYDGDTPPQTIGPTLVATFDSLEQMCFDLVRHSLQQPKCTYISEVLAAVDNELDAIETKIEDEFNQLTPSDVAALIAADIQFLNCSSIEAHYNMATGAATYFIYLNNSKSGHRIRIECER